VIPSLRSSFNAEWTQERYDAMLDTLQQRVHSTVSFPISETPIFLPRRLMEELAQTGRELIHQSMAGAAAEAAEQMVPERFQGPRVGRTPTFLQVDFGLVRDEAGVVRPKLVELQAFPSLYGFQVALADAYRSAFPLVEGLSPYLSGLSPEDYRELLREAIVGDRDPETTVLLEIDPLHQKTRPDFVMTEDIWGVRAIDVRDVRREGRKLVYEHNGESIEISRIYNRVIPDELERKKLALPFDFRDDLDVEWVGHPQWFFRISKFSIPYLRHPAVPRTWFLNEVTGLPEERERLLLKPLFSFAGGGIVFAPTDQQLAAIPEEERRLYILQEKISFTPLFETPHGATQAEIRMMYVWTDELRAVLPLVRMGRGKMMGVDHNKGLRWVGASAGFVVD
jgi:hypothetical protein